MSRSRRFEALAWALAAGLGALGALGACGGSTDSSGGGTGGAGGAGGGGGGSGGSGASGGGGSGGTNVGGGGSGGTNVGGGGSGGSASWAACDMAGQCVLVASNCCGYCNPDAPLSGYQSVHQDHQQELVAQLCADPQVCPECVTWENPNYLALCRSGTCTPVDLRTDELSACNTPADCMLRWGADCCESCGGPPETEVVAIAVNGNLGAEVCSPIAGACPPCAPPPLPQGWYADCVAGHCAVGKPPG